MLSSPITTQVLAALAVNGVALGAVAMAGAIAGRKLVAQREVWIPGVIAVALAGYLVFWAGFWRPPVGRGVAIALLTLAALTIMRQRTMARQLLRDGMWVGLGAALFVFSATCLTLVYARESFSLTAAIRYLTILPLDNTLPRVLAEIIDSGNPTRLLGGDWLTSDRPPLQTGVALLTWPLLKAGGFDLETACATAGIWYQALWFPTAWLFLRALGLPSRAAIGVAALLGCSGFLAFNTVYVWPKLGGAAFAAMAFHLWFAREPSAAASRSRLLLGGVAAGCAWLSHGGVSFSLIALTPFAAWAFARGHRRWAWLGAALAFAALATPWLLYQKYYSPPGNRLVKWHIAGVVPPDARSVSQALRDRYHEIGWAGVVETRRKNLRMLLGGNFGDSFDPAADTTERRTNDIFFPLRTAAGWTLALAAIPWLAWIRPQRLRTNLRWHGLCFAWLLGGLTVWVALMFFPEQVFTHQGTYVTQILLLCLLGAWAWLAARWFLGLVALVQIVGFLATWTTPSSAPPVPFDWLAVSGAVACGLLLLILAAWSLWTGGADENA